MRIDHIFSYLAHPSKNLAAQPPISGTSITATGQLKTMLTGLFERAMKECDIGIAFKPDDQGRQVNPCKDILNAFVANPSLASGKLIGERLQTASTNRSGLGLLFVMLGEISSKPQLLLSRFPADEGVVAQENASRLTLDFIDNVFMKNSRLYKSAVYQFPTVSAGLQKGYAIDRQVGGSHELSDYWIRDFLLSELVTTGAFGTMRMATALREAIRSETDPHVKHELLSAAHLLRNQDGNRKSARQFITGLGVSDQAMRSIQANYGSDKLLDDVFRFDREEFAKHAAYRAVELDSGAVMISEDAKFDDVFKKQVVNRSDGVLRFTTEGRVVDETIRKTK